MNDKHIYKKTQNENVFIFHQHRSVFLYEVSLYVLAAFQDLVLVQIPLFVWCCDGRVHLVLPVK